MEFKQGRTYWKAEDPKANQQIEQIGQISANKLADDLTQGVITYGPRGRENLFVKELSVSGSGLRPGQTQTEGGSGALEERATSEDDGSWFDDMVNGSTSGRGEMGGVIDDRGARNFSLADQVRRWQRLSEEQRRAILSGGASSTGVAAGSHASDGGDTITPEAGSGSAEVPAGDSSAPAAGAEDRFSRLARLLRDGESFDEREKFFSEGSSSSDGAPPEEDRDSDLRGSSAGSPTSPQDLLALDAPPTPAHDLDPVRAFVDHNCTRRIQGEGFTDDIRERSAYLTMEHMDDIRRFQESDGRTRMGRGMYEPTTARKESKIALNRGQKPTQFLTTAPTAADFDKHNPNNVEYTRMFLNTVCGKMQPRAFNYPGYLMGGEVDPKKHT